jgi:hypothetical protein
MLLSLVFQMDVGLLSLSFVRRPCACAVVEPAAAPPRHPPHHACVGACSWCTHAPIDQRCVFAPLPDSTPVPCVAVCCCAPLCSIDLTLFPCACAVVEPGAAT